MFGRCATVFVDSWWNRFLQFGARNVTGDCGGFFSEDGHWSTRTAVVNVWAAVALQLMRCALWPMPCTCLQTSASDKLPSVHVGASPCIQSTFWRPAGRAKAMRRCHRLHLGAWRRGGPNSSVMRHAKVGTLGVSIAKVPTVARLHNSNCWCSTSQIKLPCDLCRVLETSRS